MLFNDFLYYYTGESNYSLDYEVDADCYKLLTPEEEAQAMAENEAWMQEERERLRQMTPKEIASEL